MMNLPFGPGEFFGVFARYNEGVWPMQAVLVGIAIACVAFLYSGRDWSSRQIAKLLAVLWAWMAIGYHFQYFTRINPAAWAFGTVFLLGAFAFAWYGVVKKQLVFRLAGGGRGMAGAALMGFALVVYPAIGYGLGHRYPAMPTFGVPCPTTILTLGLLLFADRPPWLVYVVPLFWSAVGSLAAFRLGVYEDLALLVSGIVALAFMVSDSRIAQGEKSGH
jgi:hypothetical protein